MRTLTTITLFTLSTLLYAQAPLNQINDNKPLQPSSFYTDQKAEVLVVGTFHFNYPGQDAHVTSDKDKIDVLSPKRQKEMRELIEYIKQFRPTKIAVEGRPKRSSITETLKKYKAGEVKLNRSEHQQIGVRLAAELNLDTIYAIDSNGFISILDSLAPEYLAEMGKDYDFKSNTPYDSMHIELLNYADQVRKEYSLLETLKWMNSRDYHQRDYGAYLFGDFELGTFRGADMLSSYWYNRNLRIFRNIQMLSESEDDRILVIFGNGHASILRQLLECSPEFEFVEFDSLDENSRQ